MTAWWTMGSVCGLRKSGKEKTDQEINTFKTSNGFAGDSQQTI
jgi:hypothetical protein